MTGIICGVDVSSETLDTRIGRDGAWRQFARTAEGVAALAAFCKDQRVALVVMEATGGYERVAFAHLWAAGVPTAIANPRAVRRFAEAMGVLEKTDRIDCGVIAWYAEIKRLKPLRPASPESPKNSPASHWLESCWSASMPRHAMSETNSHMPVDKPDSRSPQPSPPPRAGRELIHPNYG